MMQQPPGILNSPLWTIVGVVATVIGTLAALWQQRRNRQKQLPQRTEKTPITGAAPPELQQRWWQRSTYQRVNAKPSAAVYLQESLEALKAELVSSPDLDEVQVGRVVQRHLSGRQQVLGSHLYYLRSIIARAHGSPTDEARSAVLRAVTKMIQATSDARTRLASRAADILANTSTGLADVVILGDFSSNIARALEILASSYPAKRGAIRTYVIAADRYFLSNQDTEQWHRILSSDAIGRLCHPELPVSFSDAQALFSSITRQGSAAFLLLGAERVLADGRILVFPGVQRLTRYASVAGISTIVLAESYKFMPSRPDEDVLAGTHSDGSTIELAEIRLSDHLRLVTDYMSFPAEVGVPPRHSGHASLEIVARYWKNQVDGAAHPVGVIFDLDGTLLDSEAEHERLYRAAAKRIGYDLSAGEYEATYRGRTDSEILHEIALKVERVSDVPELIAWKQSEYMRRLRDGAVPTTPGVLEYISFLVSEGYLLALVTSATREEAVTVLRMNSVEDKFRQVVSAESVITGKPAPDPYLTAAARLGVPATLCAVYEDSAAGVTAARTAGMTVIGVRRSQSADLSTAGAETVIANFLNQRPPAIPGSWAAL